MLALALGCSSEPPRRAAPAEPPPHAEVEQWDPSQQPPEPPPPPIAEPAAPIVGGERAAEPARVIARAAAVDAFSDSDEVVRARRYVYRVQLGVPETLGVDRSRLAASGAELFVDVSDDRLRARFVGQGWPVGAGSEVRIRGDSPGVYLFDREGGRALPPGALAEWFEGGPTRRVAPGLVVRRDPPRVRERDRRGGVPPPGALVCALLAEWSGEPREAVMRRCDGMAPAGFRIGFWRAERTADVPVELPRRALRADEIDPPAPVPWASSRSFLEPSALSRLPRMERPPHELRAPQPGSVAEGLVFVNESDARVVVTVEGVAIGWVDAGARGHFVGLQPGPYRVAAMRPLGAVVMRPRIVVVPGTTTIRSPRRRAPASL